MTVWLNNLLHQILWDKRCVHRCIKTFIRLGWGACGWALRAARRRAEPGRAGPAPPPAAAHSAACSVSRPGCTPSSPGSAARPCCRWDDCRDQTQARSSWFTEREGCSKWHLRLSFRNKVWIRSDKGSLLLGKCYIATVEFILFIGCESFLKILP